MSTDSKFINPNLHQSKYVKNILQLNKNNSFMKKSSVNEDNI